MEAELQRRGIAFTDTVGTLPVGAKVTQGHAQYVQNLVNAPGAVSTLVISGNVKVSDMVELREKIKTHKRACIR
jgi:hypothetical protein